MGVEADVAVAAVVFFSARVVVSSASSSWRLRYKGLKLETSRLFRQSGETRCSQLGRLDTLFLIEAFVTREGGGASRTALSGSGFVCPAWATSLALASV